MKRLWLIVGTLSIISRLGAEAIPLTGVGDQGIEKDCFKFVAGPNGYDLLELYNTVPKCGVVTIEKIINTEFGSKKGWNGYVKVVNAEKPNEVFYLGSPYMNRQLNFGGTKRIACYVCTGDTACDPNNPGADKRCFDKAQSGYINCDKQVNCSDVLSITTCYKTGKDQMAVVNNDLKLCSNYEGGKLENLTGGEGSYQTSQDVASSVVTK